MARTFRCASTIFSAFLWGINGIGKSLHRGSDDGSYEKQSPQLSFHSVTSSVE
jgi:hypothetical protein